MTIAPHRLAELQRVLGALAADLVAEELARERAERSAPAVPPDTAAALRVPALLSVATVAKLLGCSTQTVRRRINAGDLPAVREHDRLMVRGDELRAYIDGLERVGPGRLRRRRSRAGPPARGR